ncbi:hypothetical protein LPIBR_10069 [Lacticaseibacillus paracasei]|nr:hypothetical protein LPIBR_10069 [Lacticaseibacillus paracasei]
MVSNFNEVAQRLQFHKLPYFLSALFIANGFL